MLCECMIVFYFQKTEIANHESQINLVLKEGQRMKAEGHYGEEEIHSNILELQQQWEELKVCMFK